VVLQEEAGELRLDTSPCGDERNVVIFRKPYAKEAAGRINCKGAEKELVQVIQQ
jgi:hypothetical protein